MSEHTQSRAREIARSREITIALSRLTDSATLTEFAEAHKAKLRIDQKPDGRCLFMLVSTYGAPVTPTFHDGHALLSHIYAQLERDCHVHSITETL